MEILDAQGNVELIDRDTGQPHVAVLNIAREILALASPGVDGKPRYVWKSDWDGKVAKPKGQKPEAPPPDPDPVEPPTET